MAIYSKPLLSHVFANILNHAYSLTFLIHILDMFSDTKSSALALTYIRTCSLSFSMIFPDMYCILFFLSRQHSTANKGEEHRRGHEKERRRKRRIRRWRKHRHRSPEGQNGSWFCCAQNMSESVTAARGGFYEKLMSPDWHDFFAASCERGRMFFYFRQLTTSSISEGCELRPHTHEAKGQFV